MGNWLRQRGFSRTEGGWWAEGASRTARMARFGEFEADFRTGELRRRGLRVRVQRQPFIVLSALLERGGELVTREEIQYLLWPSGPFVDFEHGLNKAMNKLREALDDSADNPRFVETLPRRGYRFIAPVVCESRSCGEDRARQGASLTRSAGAVARHLKASLRTTGNVLATAFRAATWGF